MEISRFPCKRLLRMPGSTTTRGRQLSRDIDTGRVAFCGTENISTPNLSYAAQYLACALPCERFTSALADNPCITRGQCGSLLLHRDGLPPSTSCRSPSAPVLSINSNSSHCLRHTCRVGSEIDRQPKLSLEVIDRIIFHDRRGDLPDDHRLVGYFSSDRRVERKEQPSSLTRDRIAVIDADII